MYRLCHAPPLTPAAAAAPHVLIDGRPAQRGVHRLGPLGLLAIASVTFASGCSSGQTTGGGSAGTTTGRHASTIGIDVERRYVIGPDAARKLGYRIDWQQQIRSGELTRMIVADDSVLLLDDENFLTHLGRERGDRVWSIPILDSFEEVLGITYISSDSLIVLTTGSAFHVLEAITGYRIAKQKLEKVSSTAPVLFGNFLIYGSRSGQLVWHNYRLDSSWRGTQVSQYIQLSPVLADNFVIAIGNNGVVASVLAPSARMVWNRRALDSIVASPVAGDGAVFVASLDQHLRAYDLAGRRSPIWEYLTESPLTDSPVLIEDRIYQQVASEGLVCLESLPLDSPGGVVLWRAKGTRGNVVSSVDGNLIVWDEKERVLSILEARLGSMITTMKMPQMRSLMATSVVEGDLYATSDDGRVSRLVPRH